ncbi:MAG: HD domain-containing protein [Deltaproteobacteria bacterium]|nr:HD domain-containing protein [Deltaproteobacteria bacterium]
MFGKEKTEGEYDLIKRLVQIGVALSAEKNLNRLLEIIVDEARKFSNADGGTLYIVSDDESMLHFAIVQNDSLHVRMGGSGGSITWPPVKLINSDGSPNYANVSAYAALSGTVVNIADVYNAEGFNFGGTRKFDAETGYRSKSMLVIPMRNHENDIIGVLQLLNARDDLTGEVITFSAEKQEITESLASQAAVAISKNRLIHDLENLLESFIKIIAATIDEKSPYTGGHVRRVADLTMMIAGKINEAKEGPYKDIHFTEDQLNELRFAAWLHDVGKITTPEHIIDKATKLETVYDRINNVKTRVEIMKRDHLIDLLKREANQRQIRAMEKLTPENDEFLRELEEDIEFLVRANVGDECMTDEKIERLKGIASRKLVIDGQPHFLLDEEDLRFLSIRRGTLTDRERDIINNHVVVTYKILSQLPFPRKIKSVSVYAAAHHEKIDGTGYPNGLTGDQLSLQGRILALADVFEALTAGDRPYKKGKTLSESIEIMKMMVKDKHIDTDLFALFMEERIYLDYVERELSAAQIDRERIIPFHREA